ncbi:MAG: hypothetical protein Q4F53_07040, partial [Nesterenkonia sp.]|nr:hypothetical protein [Nesterenkonia sp.]
MIRMRRPIGGAHPKGRTSMLRRTLLTQNVIVAVGGSSTALAVDVVFVAVLGATAFQMGLLNALSTTAFLLCSVPLGLLIDRVGASRVLVWSTAGTAGFLSTLLALLLDDRLRVETALTLMAGFGVCAVAQQLSQTALVPRVVDASSRVDEPRERGITSLVGRVSTADQVVAVVVPAAAGAALSATGAEPVLAAGAATMVAAG